MYSNFSLGEDLFLSEALLFTASENLWGHLVPRYMNPWLCRLLLMSQLVYVVHGRDHICSHKNS